MRPLRARDSSGGRRATLGATGRHSECHFRERWNRFRFNPLADSENCTQVYSVRVLFSILSCSVHSRAEASMESLGFMSNEY